LKGEGILTENKENQKYSNLGQQQKQMKVSKNYFQNLPFSLKKLLFNLDHKVSDSL
jgi:hypothetical protein